MSLKKEFISVLESMFEATGENRAAGSIYALNILSPNKLSQPEITEQLSMSPATISRCLKILDNKGNLLSKNRVSGSRIWEYNMAIGSFQKFLSNPLRVLSQQYQDYLDQLESLQMDLDLIDQRDEEVEYFSNNLDELVRWLLVMKEELEGSIRSIKTLE